MIISGGARSNWRFFAKHLTRADENEVVRIAEMRGLVAETVLDALREMEAVALGTRARNFFYHADINPREDEHLTDEQWEKAVDALEANLGLEGHARFVVEHEKKGRTHRHVVWSRVDSDSMTVVPVEDNYACHERTSRELEDAFGLEPTPGVHRDGKRAERRPDNWEVFRGQRSGIDPRDLKAELTALWSQADTGRAFRAALEERGYILAKGDRRDFVIIDPAGDDHSLARRIDGVRAAEVRARMADIDREALPSVGEARKLARERIAQRRKDAPDAPLPDFAPDPDPGTRGPGGAARELDRRERPDREHRTRQRPEPVAAPGPAPLSNLSAFELLVAQWKEAYRAAVGDGSFIAEGIDWLARKLGTPAAGPPPARALTPFEQVAWETKQAFAENGGEPPTIGTTSFWQRAVATLHEVGERALSLVRDVKDKVTGFADRILRDRNPDRDHEPELER